MKVLLVYCNPNPESFTAHLRDRALAALDARGAEVRVRDLYGDGFEPVMDRAERAGYHTEGENERPVAGELADLRWCDTLIFVYPTWWFGLPAMLKGWLDRVLVPHATFSMPSEEAPISGQLANIRTLAIVTSCGARWLQSKFIGEPGRRTILRGMRFICHPRCKTRYAAIYKIDTSTHEQRTAYAQHVERLVGKL
ncbi:NAD(P)H-dependent oxidoreductase [Acuticoccus sp. MNP-M23]|uniref:NAD(P)H-dependent oxidoreductase n=1 Tax=Acuticoccus sp. MNP-M23 TaxID=3072793 RepID=UPI0028154AB2|nr:NAD(P)H-dependent oxidoreductase [Acuticoccus sp. MNP-M23]WMS43298.1 NAD(P)H-dependent oxidoreductase [Acuticoccus sp. MNP-M23]